MLLGDQELALYHQACFQLLIIAQATGHLSIKHKTRGSNSSTAETRYQQMPFIPAIERWRNDAQVLKAMEFMGYMKPCLKKLKA